jgi:multidrug resistance efflux pump
MIPYFPSTMSLIALAQGELSINAARIGIEQLKQVYLTAQAQVHIAEDEARFQTSQRVRQEGLAAKGAASGTNLEAARHTEQRTQDQRDLAKQSVATALGGATDTPTDAHPSVQAAMVARDQAAYNLANATVNAPADGVIYQAASFKAGQMVAPGQSLFRLWKRGMFGWMPISKKPSWMGLWRGDQRQSHLMRTRAASLMPWLRRSAQARDRNFHCCPRGMPQAIGLK